MGSSEKKVIAMISLYLLLFGASAAAHVAPGLEKEADRNATSRETAPPDSNRLLQTLAVPNLVAAYGFDEGAGTAAYDASGNSNHGTLTGGTAWSKTGKFGNALSFDGINDLVAVTDSASLDLTNGMTLSAWVRPKNASGAKIIIVKEDGANLAYALSAGGAGSSPTARRQPAARIQVGPSSRIAAATAGLRANRWTYLSTTYDGEHLKFYVDGVLVKTTASAGRINITSSPLIIGGGMSAAGRFFAGLIDEVKIYNRALTQREIQADMDRPIGRGLTPTAPTAPTAAGSPEQAKASDVGEISADAPTVDMAGTALPVDSSLISESPLLTISPTENEKTAGAESEQNGPGSSGAESSPSQDSTLWSTTTVPGRSTSTPVPRRAGGHPDTTAAPDRMHTVARDAAGRVGTSGGVTISVSNTEISGLVGGYGFNEGSGSSTSDISVTANTGSLLGAAAWSAGKYGSGLSFNGSNSYVNLIKTDAYDTLSEGTIMGWVKSSGTKFETWFGSDSGVCRNPFELAISNGRFEVWAAASGCSGAFNAYVTLPNPADWHHLAYVSSPAGNKIYVDGVLQTPTYIRGSATTQFFLSHAASGVTRYNIGRTANDSSETFTGLIDEVRIYNRALSETEIRSAMNTPIAPDLLPPSVSTTHPLDGATIFGTVAVSADASDNVGVAGVQFLIDGNPLGLEDTTSPYSLNWNTATVVDGVHRITAVARDAAGNITASPDINVTVDNIDDIAPAVAITGPLDASSVSATVNVTANASDNRAVAGVQFLLDGTNLGAEDTTSPYSVSWNTTAAANTTHTLLAVARDAAGNTATSAPVHVTVNNPPKLVITRPASGNTLSGSTVNVTYTTTGDLTGVDHVHFYLDGGAPKMDIDFDGIYDLTDVPPGSHLLRGILARADHSEIQGTDADPISFSTFAQDTEFPIVTITNPEQGSTVSATLGITATASDNIGVAGVQFLLDGNNLGSEDTTPPYSVNWDTTTATNGTHTLSARARDAAGNSTTSSIAVHVSNVTGPAAVGQWTPPFNLPLVVVHMGMINSGKIVMWDGFSLGGISATVWDPQTGGLTPVPSNQTNLFCSGHVVLADGRILTIGGHDGAPGVRDANIFDPVSQTWTRVASMNFRRWYPTGTTLPDGRVFVLSGSQNGVADYVPTPEIYDPATNRWTAIPSGNVTVPLYPFNFILPNGKLVNAGSYEFSGPTRTFDFNTNTWTMVDSTNIDAGSAVMYAPGKIMKTGKWANADPPYVSSHARTYVIDMNQPNPKWRETAPMNFPRAYHVLTLLPDGSVIATGGGRNTDYNDNPAGVLEAEIWNPITETWSKMSRATHPRFYHGTAMLLPDGRVLMAGSGAFTGSASPNDQQNAEIFSPPYLFKGPRPTISSTPSVVQHNSEFFVGTPEAGSITRITMIRTGTMTHSFNPDQNFQELTFSQTTGGLLVNAPAHPNIAPPGYYLLFLHNANGVPSVGSFVRMPSAVEDSVAPTAPENLTAASAIGSVNLSWSASIDNVGVAGYTVHQSATPSFTASPGNQVGQTAGASFHHLNVAPGIYYYQVVARDAAGNVSPASNEAVGQSLADNIAPSVSLNGPSTGSTVSGIIAVTATATDNIGVAGVQFELDGNNLGPEDGSAPYSIAWNTASVANGSHTLRAVARDAAGNFTVSNSVSVTVNNIIDSFAPNVNIVSPAEGATLSGTISITADATDDVGVVGVQFRLDGLALGAEDTTAPYSFTWNTAAVSNGPHTLTAIARDAAGRVGTSGGVTISVSNTEISGLVGGYGFNEGSGSSTSDISATANTGSLLGAAAWSAGKYGSGLSFNGSNSYVNLIKTDAYDTLTEGTIMGWVKSSGTKFETWFGSDSGVCRNPFELAISNGRFEVWAAASGCSGAFNASVPLPNPTEWHHLAYVSSPAGNKIYVDGVLQTPTYVRGSATTQFFLSHAASGVTRYNIGRTANDSSETFTGLIDEVRIYNRALSETEIRSAMNTPIAP